MLTSSESRSLKGNVSGRGNNVTSDSAIALKEANCVPFLSCVPLELK